MPFFYVLIEGVTWSIASQIVTGEYKYRSTLNRRFNHWVTNGVILDTYEELLDKYLNTHNIDELHIDSTDIQNKNMPKEHTYKSFKLSKQSMRLTVIGDNNKAVLDYSIDKAKQPDSVLGYNLLIKNNINMKNKIRVYGDKGYHMTDKKRNEILKKSKMELIVPKKRYKRKKKYKTKNYKPKRKRIRHSQQMKDGLKRRVNVEHINSHLHRSYKRIDKIFEKKIETFDAFVKLAISMILINKL